MEPQKFIITINREFGSGGREVACRLAELLGVKVYDQKFLNSLAEEYELTAEEMERIKAKKTNWWSDFCEFYKQHVSVAQFEKAAVFPMVNREISSIELYNAEEKLLRDLAEQESCIIIGRAGFHIFKDNPNAVKILLTANLECRVKRIMDKYGVDEKTALERIQDFEKSRENYTMAFAGVSRYDARNYDFVFNISGLSPDFVAQFLENCIKSKFSAK